jgi:hypothetical protein
MNLFKAYLLAVCVVLVVITAYADVIYEWGTGLASRWGWIRIVRIRNRTKPWALPFSRILLILIAIGCLISALCLRDSG